MAIAATVTQTVTQPVRKLQPKATRSRTLNTLRSHNNDRNTLSRAYKACMLKCMACLLERDCRYNARWLLHGMPVRGCKYKHKPYAQCKLRSSMQYSKITTSMSPDFMQEIVQNADGADSEAG